MKKYILLLICTFIATYAMAFTVTGVVYEPSGDTAIGASVVEKGKPSNGTSTNIDGEFTLNVSSPEATIIVSYIGMEPQEIKLKGRDKIEVKLSNAGGINLDEVVIVGYGVQKKVNATGAVKTIDNSVLESRPISNAVQGLQGAVAGLNITNDRGGAPGQGMSINIRGAGNLGDGSSSSPLVLIDGMEGDLSTINPNDIENVSVLKDAAAASIYGSRAPFGVILVTTKSGSNRATTVSYTGNVRMAQPINVPHMVSGYEAALMTNDAYLNSGGNAPYGSAQIEKILAFMRGENEGITESTWDKNHWFKDQASWASTDWYDVHLKKLVVSQEHNASVSGGNDKVNYFFSGNYLNQNGLFKYADEKYQRLALSGKVNIIFNKYVSFNWTSRIISTENKKPSALNDLFYHNLGRRYITLPVLLPSDSPAAGTYHYQSLIPALQDGGDQKQTTQTFYNQANLVITPIENWKIHAEINSRIENNPYTRQFKPIYQILPDGSTEAFPVLEGLTDAHSVNGNGTFNVQPSAGESYFERLESRANYFSTNFYTDYNWKLGNNEFTFLLGMQSEYYHYDRLRAASWNVAIPDTPFIPSTVGDKQSMVSDKKGEWSSLGFFGRINYNYESRYMLEVDLRADGASRFPSNKRWGWFPSFSLGWNIAQEHFWESIYNTVNMLKLRGSYGTLGNQNTNSYYPYYQSMYTTGGNIILGDAQATVLPMFAPFTSNITWERIENVNLGLDLGVLNNRLTGLVEWFQRTTKDMVGPAKSLAGVFGADAPKTNNAELRTRGWEVEISWRDHITRDWSYGISATLSDYKSTVTKYDSPDNKFSNWYQGKDMGEIWGYRWLGIAKSDAEMREYLSKVDQSSIGDKWGGGDVMYRDLNGDGRVNAGSGTLDDPGDKEIIGNNTPRYAYSFTIETKWKFLDFRAYFQGIGKRDYLFSGSSPFFGLAGEWQRSLYKEHLDYYRFVGADLGANPDAYYGRLRIDHNNIQDCDHFLQDASYLRLKNVQIGISLPQNTRLAKYVKRARLYVSGENLFTHTKLRIFDPEAVTGDWGAGKAYPQYRTWSVGLEMTF